MKFTAVVALASVALPFAAFAQSAPRADAPPPPPPAAMPGAPMRAAPDMQAVLDALAKLGGRPVETLTPAQARGEPTPADATRVVLEARGMSIKPDPAVLTTDVDYGADPLQFVRVYRPAAPTRGLRPVVVYYHGGGFVFADISVYDATPRALAKAMNAVVVSVEYRKAPEAKFPAQHDDAYAAYRWTLDSAAAWGGDVRRMAFAGESAGGNLALATAIRARDEALPMPRHILAVYPIANSAKGLPSQRDSFNAKPLNTPMLDWFAYYYRNTPADGRDPRINLVGARLAGLPPVTIVNAAIDPLRSDGETLATALRTARVPVEQRTFPGVTHEFFGMAPVVAGATQAQAYAVARMQVSLGR